jgi:hypothetical protein
VQDVRQVDQAETTTVAAVAVAVLDRAVVDADRGRDRAINSRFQL